MKKEMTAAEFLEEFFGADSVEIESETRIHVQFKGFRGGNKTSEECTLNSREMGPEDIAKTLLTTQDVAADMSWVERLGQKG